MTSYLKRVRCIGKVLFLTVLLASCKSSSKQLQDIFKDAAGSDPDRADRGFMGTRGRWLLSVSDFL